LAESVSYTQDCSTDALIFPLSPVMLGMNLEWMHAGLIYFSLLEICLVIRN